MEVMEQIPDLKSHPKDAEDGEVLEDGEIDDEDVVVEQVEVEAITEEVVENGDEDENVASEDEEQKKHRKRSHHRRRKRKHEDHKSDEKKSRHKKRKGEDGSEGNDSPPSKRKKKRKKHSRDKRGSSSPELEALESNRLSESPPLPSEQNPYAYGAYSTMDSYANSDQYVSSYDPTAPYTDPNNMSAYSYEAYGNEPDYSSGSDSCYSDFESHLKQYQNYKQNKDKGDAPSDDNDEDDDDNYYSVGYDAEQRKKRRKDSQKSNKKQSQKIKGNNDSQSNHTQSNRRRRRKIPEVCQRYLNGFCSQGDKCNYMHGEYPCKYFHTGRQCHSGDVCKFSHEAANQETEKIIKQFQDAFNSMDDSKEIEALEKVGIKPLQKPPPGMGLLPTPQISIALKSTLQNSSKSSKSSIPSLFDITVQPTPELQQKIEANSVASLKMLDDDITDLPPSSMSAPMFDSSTSGPGLLPLPTIPNPLLPPPLIPNFPPPSLLGTPPGAPVLLPTPPVPRIPPPILPPGSATPPWILRQQALLKQEQEEAKEYYEKYYSQASSASETMQNENNKSNQVLATDKNTDKDEKKNQMMHNDHHDDHDDGSKHETEEDVIRMNDDGTIKDDSSPAPDFLPAKQKALFRRIQQKGGLPEGRKKSSSRWDVTGNGSTDNWTYSSDEDNEVRNGARKSSTSTESVQSIIQIISNKKTDKSSVVDTNLLSRVANVINTPPNVSASHDQPSVKTMMSPTHKPQQRTKERKTSGSDASPSHHHQQSRDYPLRRRLSTSELYKEPLTIPLVAKQNADTVRMTHPDPRVTLSRLFGKSKTEFRGSMPVFGKDVMIPGTGKMTGLKITLSSNDSSKLGLNGDKRIDPRLSQQQTRNRSLDPRMKNKLNDPRLRVRGSSTSKTSPPGLSASTSSKSSSIPPTPTALLTKPSSSIIPSLPELNLDLARIPEQKPKPIVPPISPATTKPGDPLARLPKLLRGNVRPASNRLPPTTTEQDTPKPTAAPAIAPYDPRYINAGTSPATAKTTTAVSSSPAPYDPRVISSQANNAPALYDPRSSDPEIKKRTIQLPKLTPAPGYAARMQETNGGARNLPTGEAVDF